MFLSYVRHAPVPATPVWLHILQPSIKGECKSRKKNWGSFIENAINVDLYILFVLRHNKHLGTYLKHTIIELANIRVTVTVIHQNPDHAMDLGPK